MPDCSIRMNRGVCISQDRAGEVRRAEYRPVLGVVIHGCQEQRLPMTGVRLETPPRSVYMRGSDSRNSINTGTALKRAMTTPPDRARMVIFL